MRQSCIENFQVSKIKLLSGLPQSQEKSRKMKKKTVRKKWRFLKKYQET